MEISSFDLVYPAFKSDVQSILEPELSLARELWGNKKLIFYGTRNPKTLADLGKKAKISILQNHTATDLLEEVDFNRPFLFVIDADGLCAMGYSMP